MEHLRKK